MEKIISNEIIESLKQNMINNFIILDGILSGYYQLKLNTEDVKEN